MPVLSRIVATATPTNFPRIDHGTAAVAGIQGTVDLHPCQLAALVEAEAGYGALTDGNRGVALAGGQHLTEGETEHVDRHGFCQLGVVVQIDRLRQRLNARHLEDRQVQIRIGGQHFGGTGLFFGRAAIQHHGRFGVLHRLRDNPGRQSEIRPPRPEKGATPHSPTIWITLGSMT